MFVIDRHGGFVARSHGDGLLAYFGYPQAYEDDAERAVRAGLGLVDAVGRFQMPERLQTRVGTSTGIVVIGDLIGEGEGQERGIVGDTPKFAAMLQALAEPDAIVIDDSTRRQIGARFDVADLGPQLCGFGASRHAWRILREREGLSRFEALRSGDTQLVGRDEEIELLRRRWEQAKAGAGRVVLISGEPGIGKSRLAEAFRACLVGEPYNRLRYFCSPHHRDSALFPIIGQFERAAGFERGEAPDAKLDKLKSLVSPTASADDISLLTELLSLPVSDRYPALDLTPQRKKEKIFEVLLHQLAGLARQRPVLVVFEDLQWVDPSSRELLDLFVEHVERLPALLIATFRPEFQPPWIGQPQVTTVSLRRLRRDESDELVHGIVGNIAALSTEVIDEIVERTDGVPLFLEELTKAVLEAASIGVGRGSAAVSDVPATSLAVPVTLHASLIARLDRLGSSVKEIAQVGAAIGRDFSYEFLVAAAQRPEAELRDALGRLVDAGLVFQHGVQPQARFLFKHALVQDTAYGMLLRGPRQALHARIARALEECFPAVAEMRPQILAHHFTEAGFLEKAVAYWCRAGELSAEKSALVEATAQLRRGLRLIAELPASRERKQQELDLQVTLARTLMFLKGYAHPELVEALTHARNLVVETSEAGTIRHFSVLDGLWVADYNLAKSKAALEKAQEFLLLAQSQIESGLLVVGHRLVGMTLLTIGDYSAALSHLERAASLYRPEEHRTLTLTFPVSVLAHSAARLGHSGTAAIPTRRAKPPMRRFGRQNNPQTLQLSHMSLPSTA